MRIFLATVSKHPDTSFSQCLPKTHRCAHRLRMGLGLVTHQQHSSSLVLFCLLCQASCPSFPRLLLTPQNGEAYFTSAKAYRKEGYPWQHQTQQALGCQPTQGSRHVHQHRPPLLGTRSPLHSAG